MGTPVRRVKQKVQTKTSSKGKKKRANTNPNTSFTDQPRLGFKRELLLSLIKLTNTCSTSLTVVLLSGKKIVGIKT